jgi:hypothetical protein
MHSLDLEFYENIGANKISASTKSQRQQNLGINKTSASTKHWRQQNLGVNKPRCWQNKQSPQAPPSVQACIFCATPPSMASDLRPSWRSFVPAEDCPKWGRGVGGGGHPSLLITSRWGGAASKQATHLLWTLNPPSVSFPFYLSFAFLLAACQTSPSQQF